MNWVSEREEWLPEWADARRLKEISFRANRSSGQVQAQISNFPAEKTDADVFFSDVIEAAGYSLVCRVAGTVVDVFDISPSARRMVSWRILLPDTVTHNVAFACAESGSAASLMFLTSAGSIYTVLVSFPAARLAARSQEDEYPNLAEGATVLCNTGSGPTATAICALGPYLAAVGFSDGSLRAISLQPDASAGSLYELTDSTLIQRIVGGIFRSSGPAIVALSVSNICAGRGKLLLSYSADGRVNLWEAMARGGRLVASTVVANAQTSAATVTLRIGGLRAVLMRDGKVHLLSLPGAHGTKAGTIMVKELKPPFANASPKFAGISGGALWCFWSSPGREQLYKVNLEQPNQHGWEMRALDAAVIRQTEASANPPLKRAATEGCCNGLYIDVVSTPEEEGAVHKPVMTLPKQIEVWRGEEDSFDSLRSTSPEVVGAAGGSVERVLDHAIRWWTSRVLLPGRFTRRAIASSLHFLGGGSVVSVGPIGGALRQAVEEHLRRLSGSWQGGSAVTADATSSVAVAVATAGTDLIRACEGSQMGRGTALGIASSACWSSHAWRPAGNYTGEGSDGCPAACPLVFYSSGVACIRAVHHWAERFWATCHFSRELSNYQKVDMSDLLDMSALVEWKVCVSSWFLSQCVGAANVEFGFGLAPTGVVPSRIAGHLSSCVPTNLADHVKECSQWVDSDSVDADVDILKILVESFSSPLEQTVSVVGQSLDLLRGTWSTSSGGRETFHDTVLSDILRGSIAVSEGELACACMRDLALFGAYATNVYPNRPSTWTNLTSTLDQSYQFLTSLRGSMAADVKPPSQGCNLPQGPSHKVADVWAASYRTVAAGQSFGLRLPLASCRSHQYALQLMQSECWEALREWCAHQSMPAFSSYAAAREWLAVGRLEAARLAFELAEPAADVLMKSLMACGRTSREWSEAPPSVSYLQHVASLYVSRDLAEEGHQFLQRAAIFEFEMGACDQTLQDRLWGAAFESAVRLDRLDEACEILSKFPGSDCHFRLLARKLRSKGRVDLTLALPEQHKTRFLCNLHEHAALGTPTPGSDALLCHNHLYALHFSSQEYLKAAAVAYSLFQALQQMECSDGSADHSMDCDDDADDNSRKNMDLGSTSVTVVGIDNVGDWSLLDQQRNALLMILSALWLTEERVMIAPPARCAGELCSTFRASELDPAPSASLEDLQEAASIWMSSQRAKTAQSIVTIETLEKQLAAVEVRLAVCCSGNRGAGRRYSSPSDVAKAAASLGLLGMSLRLVEAHALDPWLSAFQPFVRLCAQAAAQSAEQSAALVTSLADAARGPAQCSMFVRGDGGEVLGAGGDVSKGWLHSLEHALQSTRSWTSRRSHRGDAKLKTETGAQRSNAAMRQLYVKVAQELLSERPEDELPEFLVTALTSGHSWVSLLRLYMKHGRLQESVDLLALQADIAERCRISKEANIQRWPLRKFPIALIVQLEKMVTLASDEVRRIDAQDDKILASSEKLHGVLKRFRVLLEEAERALA